MKKTLKASRDILKELNTQIYSNLKLLRLPLILIQVIMMIGTFGYVFIDNFGVMDAIYQTGITFTTVGFGEIKPISKMGQIFTIILIISGFAIFSIAIATITRLSTNKELHGLIKEKKMIKNILQLYNHYVIYYYNEYTEQVIEQFKAKHIPFIIIDPDPDFEEIAIKKKYPYYLIEQPHTEDAHLKSNLSSAKGVIVLSKNTSDNIAQIVSVRLFEKELQRTPYYIVSYGAYSYDIEKLKKLGADDVLSPATLLARTIGATILDSKKAQTLAFLEKIFYRKKSLFHIEECYIDKTSWISLKKIRETYLKDFANIMIIGIHNINQDFVPMPNKDVTIAIESTLLLMGSQSDVTKSIKMLQQTKTPRYVVKKIQESIEENNLYEQ